MNPQPDMTKICRTCLTEGAPMRSIYSVEEAPGDEATTLCNILSSCSSIQVLPGDDMPENVCTSCTTEMIRAYQFWRLCEKSDTTLRSCLSNGDPQVKRETDGNRTADEECGAIEEKEVEEDEMPEGDPFNGYDSGSSESDNKKKKVKKRKRKALGGGDEAQDYHCMECDETCSDSIAYRKHMAEVHKRRFKCDLCEKVLKSEPALVRHKNAQHKNGAVKKRNLPRTCNICNKTFRFHSNLERHSLIHTGEKPYLCNVCGKGFAQLSYLKIHSFIHTGEKPYKCQLCERSFAAPGTLMTHIRTHTGERPHVCKICGKDFPQSGYLSAHIRTHTGEKPVECQVCHRRFNQSGRLIIHMRIHSGEKPYTCTECGRSFAVKGTLKKHIRTHTGERPYTCATCGQAFAQSGTLATHMKIHKPK